MVKILGEEEGKEPTGRIFYNIDMAKKIRQIPCPVKNLVLDIRARPNYIAITVYESNIMEYSESQREQIMSYLLMVRELIQSYGSPCEIEGIAYEKEKRANIRF